MDGTFKVQEPEKVNFTVTLTMPLEEWQSVAKQFKKNDSGYVTWPASEFVSLVCDMEASAMKDFGEK